nr:CcdB family protein [uncultured Albidiferax sp.]
MAQFDVHRNLGAQRAQIPFVVVVQSALFDTYRRRVVAPLVRSSSPGAAQIKPSRLNPVFSIEGITVVLHPLEIVSVAVDQLGARVGDLQDQGAAIADALDEVFTRSWG